MPLGSAAEIEKKVHLYRKSARGETDEATLSAVLKTLGEQVWAPIERALPAGTTTIIVSPDAELSFISFATLLTPRDRFVGEKYSIRYVASGRDLLRETKAAESPKATMRVLANPDFALNEDRVTLRKGKTLGLALRVTEMRDLQSFSLTSLPGTKKRVRATGGAREEIGLASASDARSKRNGSRTAKSEFTAHSASRYARILSSRD